MANVTVDQLAQEITMAVQRYTSDVAAAIELETDITADAIAQEIEANSPKDTGKYAKSWKVTSRKRYGAYRAVIHNKVYQLVHLLEFGHVKAGGGRVDGKPHVRPAYDRHVTKYEKRINTTAEHIE